MSAGYRSRSARTQARVASSDVMPGATEPAPTQAGRRRYSAAAKGGCGAAERGGVRRQRTGDSPSHGTNRSKEESRCAVIAPMEQHAVDIARAESGSLPGFARHHGEPGLRATRSAARDQRERVHGRGARQDLLGRRESQWPTQSRSGRNLHLLGECARQCGDRVTLGDSAGHRRDK